MNYDSRWRKWLIVVLGILLLVIMGITMGGRSNITYVEKVTGGDVLTPVNKVFFLQWGGTLYLTVLCLYLRFGTLKMRMML